ncbi:DUF746 domain-containing protein [Burkholderia ambifaria]|uniref:DUF746 domain-containing protein n=1 Tax=Burkholderia ambifaria TaxID=152480 RepID=UPI000A971A43|nr:DUF746 domain-containing protein [Burkholderia ambifaria]
MSGHRIPRFICGSCNREFTRLHGTPLYGRRAQNMKELIPFLSQPIGRSAVSAMLKTESMNIATRVKELRSWLIELDPTGKWEARVKLGGLPTAITPAQWHFEEGGAREDLELTRRLTQEFDEVHSQSGRAPAFRTAPVYERMSRTGFLRICFLHFVVPRAAGYLIAGQVRRSRWCA